MLIQVRFDDGTTEMLDEHTVCWVGLVITQTREDPIDQHRGETVWIPSAGKRGRVETADEQIARLTAERDAEKARADRMTRCFAAVGRLTVKVGRKWHSERERADAAEMARDEARVALVQLLALWGWRADNGGFVSVNDLGDWAVTCSIADDIAYRDLLDDMKRLRAIVAEQGATLGDLINARARTGAEMVDAREALARLKKDDKARPAAEERLARAETAYQRAQAAESASAE